MHCRACGSLHTSHRCRCVLRDLFLSLHSAKPNPHSTFSHHAAASDILVITLYFRYLFNARPTFRVYWSQHLFSYVAMGRLHCIYIYRLFGFPLYGGSKIPQLVLMYLCLSYVLFNHKIWKKNHFAFPAKSKSERSNQFLKEDKQLKKMGGSEMCLMV